MDVQDVIASRDKVVARVRYTSTNTGELMGAPETGHCATPQLIDIFRLTTTASSTSTQA
jgi:predicted ester cyclase